MKNKITATVCLMVLPMALVAQTPVKSATRSAGASSSQLELKTKVAQKGGGIIAAEAALTPAELAIAERVYQGKLPCELGASVHLTADAKAPGYFNVQLGRQKFRMFPVETSTGAIRLEDHVVGVVWLQLANKSMLMSQKLGKRLADECVSPEQTVIAANLIKNPVRSVLDAPLLVAIE